MLLCSDPKAAVDAHRDAIDQAVRRVLDSGWYILGREVERFEQSFGEYVLGEQGRSVGVANGTDAIELALRAAGIGPGDMVFTVSHTAVATVAAIERCGACPVMIDIDPLTYTMDPAGFEHAAHATDQSGVQRAVVPVHLYGHPADMGAIIDIADRYGVTVIEDCAQAHGAKIGGKQVGGFGDMAAYSFYPTKNLGALGDGGAVVTGNPMLAERCASLRQYGWRSRYVSSEAGINSRLDELQAAILRVRLALLDKENAQRRAIAAAYDTALADTGLTLPHVKPGCEHVYHLYVVRSDDRDGLKAYLHDEKQIAAGIHYPLPVHRQPAYTHRLPRFTPLRQTDLAARQVLSLPMYPQMTQEQVDLVIHGVRQWVAGKRRRSAA